MTAAAPSAPDLRGAIKFAPDVVIRVTNNVETRDVLHRLADLAQDRVPGARSHAEREAWRSVFASIKIALEPEQLEAPPEISGDGGR